MMGAFAANAVPAYDKDIKYRQSDGSVITIRLHGDEFYHYITSNGKVVALGDDGMFHPASKPVFDAQEIMRRRSILMQDRKSSGLMKTNDTFSLSLGELHFLVLLIEFSDLKFTVPDAKEAFSAMLNEPGYSTNGGTGSAADFYKDNSNNRFRPIFDVYGPVTVSGAYADYGANDSSGYDIAPDKLLLEACKKLDPDVDFSIYDNDNNGILDNIFYYYAGYNEAEGAGANTIWPHASAAYEPGLKLDGVIPYSYACTSEYRGRNGESMAGIGTFCHEFGHVLGLPDYYDVDYEENGTSNNLYTFSLMASGSYNNNGRTPPYLCSVSRWLLGWIDDLKLTTAAGQYTLKPVQNDDCLSTPTSMDGEFFIYEVRTGEGWDSAVRLNSSQKPIEGLLIYHVDMSENIIDGKTAASLWEKNELNNYQLHPCYYIVSPKNGYSDYNDFMWPGTTGTTSFESKEWSGARTGYQLSDITYADRKATFTLSQPTSRTLHGRVADTSDKPLEGVAVTALSQTVYTDVTGVYSIEFPLDIPDTFDVEFRKEMYRPRTAVAKLVTAEAVLNATLLNYSEFEPVYLSKHGTPSQMLGLSGDGPWSYTIGVLYTAEELKNMVGMSIQKINFRTNGQSERVDAFVDFGTTRALTRQVESYEPKAISENYIDISDAGLKIPAGKDMIFGLAIKNNPEHYSIVIDTDPFVEGGGLFIGDYVTSGTSSWSSMGYNVCIDCELGEKTTPFDAVGLRNILNPGNGQPYPVGTVFELSLEGNGLGEMPTSISWTIDGTPVSGSSVTLSTAGKHTVKAVLTYSDGSTEDIEQVVQVQ